MHSSSFPLTKNSNSFPSHADTRADKLPPVLHWSSLGEASSLTQREEQDPTPGRLFSSSQTESQTLEFLPQFLQGN